MEVIGSLQRSTMGNDPKTIKEPLFQFKTMSGPSNMSPRPRNIFCFSIDEISTTNGFDGESSRPWDTESE